MSSILITGTTSGIGLETAVLFARSGWDVYAGVRSRSRADDLLAALDGEGLEATLVEGDISDEHAVRRVVDDVVGKAGRLDVLVNNAGRVVIAPVEETDDDEARAVMDANFFGALHMMRACLPIMRAQGAGTIVNISSIGARVTPSYYGVYAASKRAIEAISEAVHIESQEYGIRVVLIEPGNFRTNIMRSALVARRFGEDSPYLGGLLKMKADAKKIYAQIDADSAPGPELVARAILAAVEDADARFSYAVGEDAEFFLECLADAPPDELPMLAISERLAPDAM